MKINTQQNTAEGMSTVLACINNPSSCTWHVPTAYSEVTQVVLLNIKFYTFGLKARCNSSVLGTLGC